MRFVFLMWVSLELGIEGKLKMYLLQGLKLVVSNLNVITSEFVRIGVKMQ